MSTVSIYDDTIFALHGAAVEWGNRAYVFLAATTSGKTTLTSYLTSNGFGYITEDCVLLDRETFHVRPNTTPIHLREGGLEVLKKNNAVPERLELLYDTPYIRHVYTPKNCVTTELPLADIFFIERTDGVNQLIDMNMNERIVELMKSPITNYQIDKEYIKFISKLAKQRCRRLLYSDMDYVREVIQNG